MQEPPNFIHRVKRALRRLGPHVGRFSRHPLVIAFVRETLGWLLNLPRQH